jgi:PAS domain S-box-containing protein
MDQISPPEPPHANNLETKPIGIEAPIGEKCLLELAQSNRDLRDFIEHAAVAMHWVAGDGTILWANEAELKLLGYSREEYIGHSIAEFHVDQPVIVDILRRLTNDETLNGYEARLRCKDGSTRYVSINSSVYREDGRFVHTRCVTLDVSGKKEAAELQERLAAIVSSSDDAIISKDLDGIIRSWNSGAERLFGYTAGEVIGKPITIVIPVDRLGEEPEILSRLQRGERVDHFETIRRRKDGTLLDISLTISPVKDSQGRVVGASKVARDITERRRAEASIQALNEQLGAELSAMARMQKISTRLVEAQDFKQLLEEIVAAGTEITRADMGNIQLLEDGALKIVAQRGFEAPFLDFFNSVSHGLAACGTALQRGERVIVEDVAESPVFTGTAACAVMLAAGARAVQATPLVSRSGRVLGMFSTHYQEPGRPGERELRMLDLLARQAADLIEAQTGGSRFVGQRNPVPAAG